MFGLNAIKYDFWENMRICAIKTKICGIMRDAENGEFICGIMRRTGNCAISHSPHLNVASETS